MKIHTDTETLIIVNRAFRAARAAGQIGPDVYTDKLIQAGSRTRRYAADVHLASSTGGPGTDHPRRPNSGGYGADGSRDLYAATYAEWGWFIAHVFAIDPDAVVGPYKGIDDFHRQVDADSVRRLGSLGGNSFRLPTRVS